MSKELRTQIDDALKIEIQKRKNQLSVLQAEINALTDARLIVDNIARKEEKE